MITYEYGEEYLPEIWYQCSIQKKKLIPDWCQLKTNKQDEQN